MEALSGNSSNALRVVLASSATIVAVAALTSAWRKKEVLQEKCQKTNGLLSVNYHFLRECNYGCKFCFHTDLRSEWVGLDKAREAIQKLHEAGTEKLNFSGGEPFLKAKDLGRMCQFAKKLGIKSVSIISNGSLITKEWIDRWGEYVDIMGISCDSFNDETNEQIGRYKRSSRGSFAHKDQAIQVAKWCATKGIMFKLNSVVNKWNCGEDMTEGLRTLQKIGMKRWKVFQVLPIEGENAGQNKTDRDVTELLISPEQYSAFLARHADFNPVYESNELMRNSYVILDEKCRFLNNQDGTKRPTMSILDVGVDAAFEEAGFEAETFMERGGVYDWSRKSADIEDAA
mmetsp:Transcript_56279/g.131868  ORF Transcript_56279/g.131868 Transcript_56279/m.131868 type:complete len:344 (-) Transcript_56279:95-1126(-)